MTPTEIWLARHGETDWSGAGRHTGRTDIPLNDNGRGAARRLGEILAGQRFDLVLTSPLQRARETCELAGLASSAQVDDDLREWDYGEYEGITTEEIRRTRPDWNVFADGCPGGESIAEVGRRADRVIAQAKAVDGRVIIFGHGHALRVLAARWVALDPQAGARFMLETATISVLGWEREMAVISRWNAD